MNKRILTLFIISILIAGSAPSVLSLEKKDSPFSRLGEITLPRKGVRVTIGVGQFIGRWLSSENGFTVTIKPGGRWKSVSPEGDYQMSGKWKLEKGALYWTYHGYHTKREEINIVESISKDRFVIRKPDGSLVEFKRIKY